MIFERIMFEFVLPAIVVCLVLMFFVMCAFFVVTVVNAL